MKLAIITRADEHIKNMTNITLPVMKKYADSVGADFIIMDHRAPFLTSDNKEHYRILKVYDYFDEYDRIVCMDSDMLINKDCPNVFDAVPYDMIGSIYEDKGSRRPDRLNKIKNVQRVWGDVGWKDGYTNAGTFVMSKIHRDIFKPHNGKYWLEWGSGDIHLSYNIHKYGFKVKELSYKWNHMTMFSEPWNKNADRFKSYIIHYAGGGVFDKGVVSNRVEQIKKDYNRIYGKSS